MVHKCTSMLWGVLRHDILCFVQQLKRSDQIDPISNIYPQHVSVHHSNSCSTSFGDSTIQRVIERLSFHCPSGGYSGLVPPQANDVVTSVNGTYHKPKHPMCVLCTGANLDRGRSTVSLAESWKTKRCGNSVAGKSLFFPTRTYLGKRSLQNEREALLK